ncbi:MAG TPA: NAD(P)-dependent oxidoreductase [Chloroflexota bacterium]|nr:NAD(P)-dependent oxidoreductase [Chloroflexota bacterium]
MKIVVTGGSGRLGQHTVDELLAHGHSVLSLDRVPPAAPRCPAWVADLTRGGDAYQALQGADGVVHLAAWQAPGLTPDTETFANNVSATYNVLKAASDLGVRHVVLASSIAAYGFIYARHLAPPDYLPLDEAHPCTPQDPYGLSKVVGEAIADSFARLGPTSIASLRFPGVVFDLTYRSIPDRWRDPGARRGGFWTYVDARDAARACRLAVEADLAGHEVFNVAAPTSIMREPTTELLRRYGLEPRRLAAGLTGNWSAMDSGKAERMLGYRAEHQWQQYVVGAVGDPDEGYSGA